MERLRYAATNNDIDELYAILAEDPHILRRMTETPFAETPLHVAAARGNTLLTMEVAIMEPPLTQKLNLGGLSPMHVALHAEQFETARALMNLDPELIRVKGKDGFTALHHVASKEGTGELELLAEFLYACKSSIDDLTSRGETAVHVAVKNNNLEALKILLGKLKRVDRLDVLDVKNIDGNTVLHIAASTGPKEAIKLLVEGDLFFGVVKMRNMKVNAMNSKGKTALDILEEEMRSDEVIRKILLSAGAKKASRFTNAVTLSWFLKNDLTLFERLRNHFRMRNESTRDMILVVATLIATAVFQAALSPPGGYWQDNGPSTSSTDDNPTSVAAPPDPHPHQAGHMIMKGYKVYLFMLVNGFAFFTSMSTIMAMAVELFPRATLIYISAIVLTTTYAVISTIQVAGSLGGKMTLYLIAYVFALLSLLPPWLYFRYQKLARRVDSTKCWATEMRSRDRRLQSVA